MAEPALCKAALYGGTFTLSVQGEIPCCQGITLHIQLLQRYWRLDYKKIKEEVNLWSWGSQKR